MRERRISGAERLMHSGCFGAIARLMRRAESARLVLFGNPARDRQPQPRAAGIARPRAIGTIESFKYLRQILRGDSDACIFEREHGRIVNARE
jgi:hypothetical protein